MLDGYDAHYTEPDTHFFDVDPMPAPAPATRIPADINPAYEQAWADRSDLIEYDPIQPELGPVEQGTKDAYDGTPDWTRASGDPVYRVTLIRTLILLSAAARTPGQMTNAVGMSFEESWAESGAPGGIEEW